MDIIENSRYGVMWRHENPGAVLPDSLSGVPEWIHIAGVNAHAHQLSLQTGGRKNKDLC